LIIVLLIIGRSYTIFVMWYFWIFSRPRNLGECSHRSCLCNAQLCLSPTWRNYNNFTPNLWTSVCHNPRT